MQMDQVRQRETVHCTVAHTVWHTRPTSAAVHIQILANTADMIKNFAVTYLVDISEVPDFNTMYEVTLLLGLHGDLRPE